MPVGSWVCGSSARENWPAVSNGSGLFRLRPITQRAATFYDGLHCLLLFPRHQNVAPSRGVFQPRTDTFSSFQQQQTQLALHFHDGIHEV